MNSTLSNIHANRLAKYNYKYIDSNGDVYIGTKEGRLTRFNNPIQSIALNNTGLANTEVATTDTDITQETNLSPFLLMGG
jgi:hypothetical protein